jgi:hypothetical protein
VAATSFALSLAAACAGPASEGRPAEGQALVARLDALSAELGRDVDLVTVLYASLPDRVRVLPAIPPDVKPADLDVELLRTALQSCFQAPGNTPCTGGPADRLAEWAAKAGEPMGALVQAKLADVAAVRVALQMVAERAAGLVQRAAEARVGAERIVGDALALTERTVENPLEAPRRKDEARADLNRVVASRVALDKLLARVETEVRPLPDRVRAFQGEVALLLATFGDVRPD